ncbi:hypothetical protein TGAMA5MH_03789 [Trichoderma gamsii]|uniref:Uncharacterized protein n=1 Tax=Trichoderma gamsii TaxID=398673 RepID=A0A2K0TFZ2_9HYPO|nr:hypothetical protein TGAMA5MH_03789 [Trichoderma gamsii]
MEAAIKSKTLSKEGSAESTIDFVSHIDKLPIPEKGDSIDVLQRKLTALTDAMRHGQSIASITNYAAATIKERDPIKIATADMPPQEVEAWSLYIDGNYPLPKIDWSDSCDPIPKSKRPLRTAYRRAEALNRLYKIDNAEPCHAVWFTRNEAVHLDLVKAMARVIGAEKNLLSGQDALDATQIADLQSINEILALSAQIMDKSRRRTKSQEIASAQQILGSHRDLLRESITRGTRKRKQDSKGQFA